MWDYAEDLATAREMILDTGRAVTLQALAVGPADPAEPLAGSAAPPDPLTGVPATFVYPSGLVALGMSAEMRAIFATFSATALIAWDGVNDLSNGYDILYDTDGTSYKIQRVEKLQPGPIIIMFYIGLTRQ